jgi:hypothetical protein
MKKIVSFAESLELHKRPDAHLLLTKPQGYDVAVISFKSRKALEAFNKRANLHAVIKTQVPLNCAIYKHQSDNEARKERLIEVDILTRRTDESESDFLERCNEI